MLASDHTLDLSGHNKLPIFCGRWQPFHNGHLQILEMLLQEHECVILGIINPDPSTMDYSAFPTDPLYYWERLYILTQLLRAKGWESRVRMVPMWNLSTS